MLLSEFDKVASWQPTEKTELSTKIKKLVDKSISRKDKWTRFLWDEEEDGIVHRDFQLLYFQHGFKNAMFRRFDPVMRDLVTLDTFNFHQEHPRTINDATWSVTGTYLVTFDDKGLTLWCMSYEKYPVIVCTFAHANPYKVDFSPNEQFMLSWNKRTCRLFAVLTETRLYEFGNVKLNNRGEKSWPFFVWSSDSRRVAYTDGRELFVYEVPSMRLVKDFDGLRVPLRFPNCEFEWSPESPLLVVWKPSSSTEIPGRLSVLQFPIEGQESLLTRQNILFKFNVIPHAQLKWHPKGDFLIMKTLLSRKSRGKAKKYCTQLDIFRMKDKQQFPTKRVQLDEEVRDIAFEGCGCHRFVALCNRKLIFYNVALDNSTFDTKVLASVNLPSDINSFKWSPDGCYFLCGSVWSDTKSVLLFGQLTDPKSYRPVEVKLTYCKEHTNLQWVEWDPTGRAVISVAAPLGSSHSFRYVEKATIMVWSFQGVLFYKQDITDLSMCMWRPHPLLRLLPHEMLYTVMDNYSLKRASVENQKRTFLSLLQEVVADIERVPGYKDNRGRKKRFNKLKRLVEGNTDHICLLEKKNLLYHIQTPC